jgi:tellurite methyltransferase
MSSDRLVNFDFCGGISHQPTMVSLSNWLLTQKRMPREDALHWNARYTERLDKKEIGEPRPFLTENARYLPSAGLGLDIAMGLGNNAHFLISRGLQVIGIDISEVGVRASKEKSPNLLGVVADLAHFYLPENTFDVILNFFYLQRNLWSDYVSALRPGGVLFFETMTDKMLSANPDINSNHILATGELKTAFFALETLVYEEVSIEEKGSITFATQQLIARKPS